MGSRQAPQPRQLQVGRGDISRMQAGHPTLPGCALLLSAFSVHCSHRNKITASACSLPGAYLSVLPILLESHQSSKAQPPTPA